MYCIWGNTIMFKLNWQPITENVFYFLGEKCAQRETGALSFRPVKLKEHGLE